MPSMKHDDVLLRLIKDVNDIRSALRRTVANLPLYDIANENTPAQITADQNNYVPGNYDVLRLSSDAVRTITGIKNGVKGRKLQLFNVGSYGITLANESTSSDALNRFSFVNASDFIIPPDGNVLLYYDATSARWIGGDMTSIYDTLNETTPAQITANQNNYDIGLNEVLRLSTDAVREITGFAGGVKGRTLQIINIGSSNIVFVHESASSSAGNRITVPGSENIVLYPNGKLDLYYDGVTTRWRASDQPSWAGSYGYSMFVVESGTPSIASGTTQKLLFDTVRADDWNMWDATNNRIVIPATGCYMGVIGVSFEANSTGYRALHWNFAGANIYSQSAMAITAGGQVTQLSCAYFYNHTAGQTIELYATQNSGSSLNLYNQYVGFVRVR